MRDYGKVHSSFWSSPTIDGMTEDGRMLALYLITSPHSTIAGVFRLPDGYVCEDMKWSAERVAQGFAELLAKGYANRCGTTKWVWVCKHFEWNKPENPNQCKSAAKIALSIPDECDWKLDFMRVCGPLLGIEPPTKPNPFATVPKPFLNQEQEQKQEQKQEHAHQNSRGGDAAPPPKARAVDNSTAGEAVRLMAAAGVPCVGVGHPELLALIGRGVTPAMFGAAATKSVAKGKGFAYAIGVLKSELEDAAAAAVGPVVGQLPWDHDRPAIEAEGERLGLGRWCGNAAQELFTAYTGRVRQAREAGHATAGA